MLHIDAGSAGTYEFPGEDGPVMVAGEIVLEPFGITGGMVIEPAISVVNQDIAAGSISIPQADVEVPGWVVIHTQIEGAPGPVIGYAALSQGMNSDVAVSVNPAEATETLDAICLLPDHIHCIWILPEDDADFSIRWKEIKRLFTKGYLQHIGRGEERNASRRSRGEAAIWQRRFWEHTIRDDKDLNQHRDYIHYNPVKHGLVNKVSAWPWSSFHRYVRSGYYDREWGEAVGEDVQGMKCGE